MEFLKCAVHLFLIGITGFFLGRVMSKYGIDASRFVVKKLNSEDDGRIYELVFIRKWHNKLPDMSKIFPHLMPEKAINIKVLENVPVMINETYIAEFIHSLLGVFGFFCIGIWDGLGGFVVTLVYEMANLPYILIQRYNRPRLQRVFDKYCRAQKNTSRESLERVNSFECSSNM